MIEAKNLTDLGRYHLRPSNRLCARWLPPSWGCAPSHLPPGGRYFSEAFCVITTPKGVQTVYHIQEDESREM